MKRNHQESVERVRDWLKVFGFVYHPPKSGRDDKKHQFVCSRGERSKKLAAIIWIPLYNGGFVKNRIAAETILVGNGHGELWKFVPIGWTNNRESNLERLINRADLATRFLNSEKLCPIEGHLAAKRMKPTLIPDGKRHKRIAWACPTCGDEYPIGLDLSDKILRQTDQAFLLDFAAPE